MGEPSKRASGRPGREIVVDAAASLARSASLSDIFRFLTDRAVAEEAGVQPGTVHYHFGARRGARSLPLLTFRSLLEQDPPEPTKRTREEVEEAIAHDPGSGRAILADIRDSAAQHLRETLPSVTSEMGLLLGAAVAPNDSDVATDLLQRYSTWTDEFSATYRYAAAALDRQFRTDIEIDSELLAIFITAMFDGLLMRSRFDPRVRNNDAIPEVFGELAIRLFVGATADDDHPNDLTELRDRLFDTAPEPATVSEEDRQAVITAATEAYFEGGPTALGPIRLATRTPLRRSTVVAVAPSRGEMAVLVWSHLNVERLSKSLEVDHASQRLSLVEILNRYLVNLVDCARRDIELTRLMIDTLLRYMTRYGPVDYASAHDPRAMLPLPRTLAAVLADRHEQLRPGIADTEAQALSIASTLINVTFINCLVRPEEAAMHLVDHIVTTTLRGIMDR